MQAAPGTPHDALSVFVQLLHYYLAEENVYMSSICEVQLPPSVELWYMSCSFR